MRNIPSDDIYLKLLEEISQDLKESKGEQKQLRECFEKLDKKVDLHIQKTEFELKRIIEQDQIQNDILAFHSQRSTELKRENDLMEKRLRAEVFGEGSPAPEKSLRGRIEALEEPREWLRGGKRILLATGGLAAAVFGIIKAIEAVLQALS